jgi:hypothetical protein
LKLAESSVDALKAKKASAEALLKPLIGSVERLDRQIAERLVAKDRRGVGRVC